MKKLLIISALGLSSLVSINNIQAEDNKTEQHIGFGGGLIVGALAGGPVGAIIGAISGVLIGEQINEAEKVGPLTEQLAEDRVQLDSLQVSLAERDRQLDHISIQLQEHEATTHKVARSKALIKGLQVDLMFRTNSSELESGAIDKLSPLVLMLEQFPQLELQLTGHGDVLGTVDGNKQVAQKRIVNVKQAFIEAGVAQERIHLINSGKQLATAALEDVDGRALDRRVQITFMQKISKPKLALK